MFAPEDHRLLDFGRGRKLERFRQYVVDRPCPAADACRPVHPELWSRADARYQRSSVDAGTWQSSRPAPKNWTVSHESIVFELCCTERGQIGLFAEQAENWVWIAQRVRQAARPVRVLNLFAYTGGSTLAAAAAGAHVVHVDAARSSVAWARRNARHSGLADAPIRWIVEDAMKFAGREVRRGNQYDAVILDPPTYGHGPKGQAWKIRDHLMPLLRVCGALTAQHRRFVLLTCHSPGYGPAELSACMSDALFGHCDRGVVAAPLFLRTADGRRLPSGVAARWPK